MRRFYSIEREDMTPINLIKALAKEIRRELKDFKLQAEYQPAREIRVYEQIMPLSQAEDDTFFPNVVVNLVRVDEDGEDSIAMVNLSVAVYGGEDEEGWQDLFNIVERIRQFVLTHTKIAGRFPLEMPIYFAPVPPAEQPEPFFYFDCIVRYRIATPRESIPI